MQEKYLILDNKTINKINNLLEKLNINYYFSQVWENNVYTLVFDENHIWKIYDLTNNQ